MTNVSTYAKNRLQALSLTASDGFFWCKKSGNILIEYFDPETGAKLRYEPKTDRKTQTETPLKVYQAQRISPENLTPETPKYKRPYGLPSYPYFCPKSLLNDPETLLLTEGEIKAAVCNKHKICAVGFSGIYNYSTSYFLNTFLETRKNKIANIVINYDFDALRENNSAFIDSCIKFYLQLKAYYLLTNQAQPKIYICINRDPKNKGIDDIFEAQGQTAVSDFRTLQTSKLFSFTEIKFDSFKADIQKAFKTNLKKNYPDYLLTSDYYFDFEKTRRNYLTDIFDSQRLNYNSLFGKIWNVPTGTGKTNIVIELAKTNKIIMFVPLLNIAEQIYKTASKRGINTQLYTYENRNNVLTDIYELKKDIQFIVCTYQSANSLFRCLDNKQLKQFNVVCDEIHTAVSVNYLSEDFNNIFGRRTNFKSLSGLTGTYLKSTNPLFNILPVVTLKLRNYPKPETKIIHSKLPVKTASRVIEQSLKENRKVLILLNSKRDRLKQLSEYLNGLNIDFDILNSGTKDSDCYKQLITSETLTKDVNICTSVIEMGTNIIDKKQTDIIVIGEFHASTIKQFSERTRNAENKRIFVINQFKKYQNNNPEIAEKIEANLILSKHLNNCQSELKSKNLLLDSYIQIKDSDGRQNVFQYFDQTDGEYKTDYFAIDNYCFNLETKKQNTSPSNLRNALIDFDFEFSVILTDNKTTLTASEIAEQKENRENKKIARQNDFKTVLSELKTIDTDNIETAKIIIENKISDGNQTDGELIFYNKFLNLTEYSTSYKTLLKNFAETDGSEKHYKLLFSQYKHAVCDFSGLVTIQTAIKNSFSDGEIIDRNQLIDRFLTCIDSDKNVYLNKETFAKRTDSILSNVRQFFGVKLYGKSKKHYRISKLIL